MNDSLYFSISYSSPPAGRTCTIKRKWSRHLLNILFVKHTKGLVSFSSFVLLPYPPSLEYKPITSPQWGWSSPLVGLSVSLFSFISAVSATSLSQCKPAYSSLWHNHCPHGHSSNDFYKTHSLVTCHASPCLCYVFRMTIVHNDTKEVKPDSPRFLPSNLFPYKQTNTIE
ncbi:hypothetical protein BKA57DRAFT_58976 [Linnemannia elongata]|nr:hypothetical protein BKA57DRAFT_58976 [Linnemannia elongata]